MHWHEGSNHPMWMQNKLHWQRDCKTVFHIPVKTGNEEMVSEPMVLLSHAVCSTDNSDEICSMRCMYKRREIGTSMVLAGLSTGQLGQYARDYVAFLQQQPTTCTQPFALSTQGFKICFVGIVRFGGAQHKLLMRGPVQRRLHWRLRCLAQCMH